MRFGVSEGMVMAAGPGGKEIFLLSPDSGARRHAGQVTAPARYIKGRACSALFLKPNVINSKKSHNRSDSLARRISL